MKTLITFIMTRIVIFMTILVFVVSFRTHVPILPDTIYTTVDPAEIEPIFEPSFPADIMMVEFKDEIWKYRLFKCGKIKKVVVLKESEEDDRS